jgi:hypothetical protein
MRNTFVVCLTLSLAWLTGCQSNKYKDIPVYQPTTQKVTDTGLVAPAMDDEVKATVTPPVGWKAEPFKSSKDHTHQVWLSPTGNTAYGVIHFGIPFPMPATWLLDPWLEEMKKSEGEANLIGQPTRDDALPGVRFVVEGGDYKMRVNLITRGWKAWAVYAGTLRAKPEVPAELELAERARENTRVGEK